MFKTSRYREKTNSKNVKLISQNSNSSMNFSYFYALIGMPLVSLMTKYTYIAPSVQGMANISMAT